MSNRRGFMIVLGGKNSGNNDTEKAKTGLFSGNKKHFIMLVHQENAVKCEWGRADKGIDYKAE